MSAPRLTLGPDCERCVAPCCTSLLFAERPRDRVAAAERMRPFWRAAGADLLPVLPGVYRCSASTGDGGCTIYANRPQTCRAYDCRTEGGDWLFGAPRCNLS